MTLVLCAYVFGAAVTGAWSIGITGLGRDKYDRLATAVLIAFWPVSWFLAAGMAIAEMQERWH